MVEKLDHSSSAFADWLFAEQRAGHRPGVLAARIDSLGWFLPSDVDLLSDSYLWTRKSDGLLHRVVGGRRVRYRRAGLEAALVVRK